MRTPRPVNRALSHITYMAIGKVYGIHGGAHNHWNVAPFRDGAGFLDVGYDPDTGHAS
jgi:hypothetical protein